MSDRPMGTGWPRKVIPVSIQNVLVTVILAVIAVALLIWFFGDFLDDKDRKERDSAPITAVIR
jgi:capsular polysaccharide biosynthesis protein